MSQPALQAGIVTDVLDERKRQDSKWGVQSHPDAPPPPYPVTHTLGIPSAAVARTMCQQAFKHGRGSWGHILNEEHSEVHEEAGKSDPATLRTELIQLAAVALAWVEDLDRRETQ